MASSATSQKVTFYDELGVATDASEADIKKAYRKKSLEWHPDKNPEEEKEEWTAKFQHLQEIMETLSNAQSRMIYDEKTLKAERGSRVLVLIDMNGSLLCKVGKRDRCNYRGYPDFEDKDNRFFVRPHVKEFLEAMLDPNSNIAFAIYTSRQAHNAMPQVDNLFKCAGVRRDGRLFSVYAGDDFSVPDHDAGPYKSKRCLRKIWKDRHTCARLGVKFDECTTVNLDNEVRKLKDHLRNGIVVPGYGVDNLGRQDDVLIRLKDYLLRLARESHGDVREYMQLFPFSADRAMGPRPLPPVSNFLDDDEPSNQVDQLTAGISGMSLTGTLGPTSLRPQTPSGGAGGGSRPGRSGWP